MKPVYILTDYDEPLVFSSIKAMESTLKAKPELFNISKPNILSVEKVDGEIQVRYQHADKLHMVLVEYLTFYQGLLFE